MRIIISINVIPGLLRWREKIFIVQTIKKLAGLLNTHQFIITGLSAPEEFLKSPENVSFHNTGTRSASPVIWKWWYDIKIPLLLKKHKANLFISCDGIVSLRTKTPQILWLTDFPFSLSPSHLNKIQVLFLKKYYPSFFNTTKFILTLSDSAKKRLTENYHGASQKTNIIPPACGLVSDINAADIFHLKEKNTGGCEYFLFIGETDQQNHVLNLLKAFSIFKKMQQSGMKLMIALTGDAGEKPLMHNLKTYKFRKDVILVKPGSQHELNLFFSGAYAFILPSFYTDSGLFVHDAMQNGTPVLTSQETTMTEMTGDAALYFNPNDFKDIAAKMMLIYKDEQLRKLMIDKGRQTSSQYSSEKSAQLLKQFIETALD